MFVEYSNELGPHEAWTEKFGYAAIRFSLGGNDKNTRAGTKRLKKPLADYCSLDGTERQKFHWSNLRKKSAPRAQSVHVSTNSARTVFDGKKTTTFSVASLKQHAKNCQELRLPSSDFPPPTKAASVIFSISNALNARRRKYRQVFGSALSAPRLPRDVFRQPNNKKQS